MGSTGHCYREQKKTEMNLSFHLNHYKKFSAVNTWNCCSDYEDVLLTGVKSK